MKKRTFVIVSVILVLILIASGAAFAAPNKVYRMRNAHTQAPDHPVHICMLEAAEKIKERTKGAVLIEVFPSSQLGGDRDVAEGFGIGTIEMGIFGTGGLQVLDKRLIVEELPFAFPTKDKAYAAVDGDLGRLVNVILLEQGIVGLSYWESGHRHITNSVRPIKAIGDINGLTIRVPPAEMRIDTFKQVGALPTPMPLAEVFTALQTRVVDGQENPLATIYTLRFFEVQKYLTLSYHIWGSFLVAIAEKPWNDLPEEYRKIILEEVEVIKPKQRQMITEMEAKALEDIKATGIEINELDIAEFQKAVSPIWDKYSEVFGKELVDAVRKYAGN